MELPLWLKENEPSLCRCGCSGIRKKQSFIEKTLKDIIHFLSDSVFSEEVALQNGFLQGFNPQVKVLALFFLLIILNLISNLGLLWIFYLFLLAVSKLSGISVKFILKRVWLVIPLFTGIMVFPALFNWIRVGEPLWIIGNFGHPVKLGPFLFPSTLSITKQGLWGDILLVSRVGISVSIAVVITLTTRWTDFLRALRSFFIPKIFVITLEMTYRYIFVLITGMEDMFFARKARDAGQSTTKEQRRFVASAIAGLFGKSIQMSEEVYSAMLARGYAGEIRTMRRFRLQWFDAFASVMIVLMGLTFYVADKVLGG